MRRLLYLIILIECIVAMTLITRTRPSEFSSEQEHEEVTPNPCIYGRGDPSGFGCVVDIELPEGYIPFCTHI